MSERLSQSEPEKNLQKHYWIPVSDHQVVLGSVNFRKQRVDASRRIEGPDIMIRQVEVSYEAIDEYGNSIVVTKMISDHHLTDVGQRDLEEKYLKLTAKRGDDIL